ncbi:hypothetical protein EST38_g10251 [Candolleomyces aberdarensis]|uniref:Uncharacterized protein n=1 Tax=Candolleomyces aberdarensis TaxID=2316362 RepID=A0A4Q2D7V0_9AGAR|nr:hypothetical protein EST38_g10251 [Candolleomyces aberdarensis]
MQASFGALQQHATSPPSIHNPAPQGHLFSAPPYGYPYHPPPGWPFYPQQAHPNQNTSSPGQVSGPPTGPPIPATNMAYFHPSVPVPGQAEGNTAASSVAPNSVFLPTPSMTPSASTSVEKGNELTSDESNIRPTLDLPLFTPAVPFPPSTSPPAHAQSLYVIPVEGKHSADDIIRELVQVEGRISDLGHHQQEAKAQIKWLHTHSSLISDAIKAQVRKEMERCKAEMADYFECGW